MKKTTLQDISQLTGFSKTVISRVLSGKAEEFRISRETVEKILQTCEKERYKPNYIAQMLRKQTTNTIGLILPRLDYQFFGNLSSTIITEAYKYGYWVVTMITMEDPQKEAEAIETLINRQVEGIIISPCSPSSQMLTEVAKKIPLIQIDRYFTDENLSYITTDNYEGGKIAIQHLIEHGHQHILCLQQGIRYMPTKERVRGAVETAQSTDNIQVTVCGDDLSKDNSYIETRLALNSPNPPTAILTITHFAIPGVLQALREKGLLSPKDISLITFDDSSLLDYTVPPITRVVQPVEKICTTAVRVLSDSIAKKKACETKLLIPPFFTMRESVKRIG